jgi:Silicon transporter
MLNGAWVLGWIHKRVAGFQIDEVYIGTAKERAAKNMEDHEENLQIGAGHMIILPGFYETAPPSLQKLLRSDPSVAAYIKSVHDNMSVGDMTEVEQTDHDKMDQLDNSEPDTMEKGQVTDLDLKQEQAEFDLKQVRSEDSLYA